MNDLHYLAISGLSILGFIFVMGYIKLYICYKNEDYYTSLLEVLEEAKKRPKEKPHKYF